MLYLTPSSLTLTMNRVLYTALGSCQPCSQLKPASFFLQINVSHVKLGYWFLRSKFVFISIKCHLLCSNMSSFDSVILCIIYYLSFCVIWNLISMPSVSSSSCQKKKNVRMCILVKRIIKTPTAVNYSLHAFLLEQRRTVFRKMDFIESYTFINAFSPQIFIETYWGTTPCYVLQSQTRSMKTWSLTLKSSQFHWKNKTSKIGAMIRAHKKRQQNATGSWGK